MGLSRLADTVRSEVDSPANQPAKTKKNVSSSFYSFNSYSFCYCSLSISFSVVMGMLASFHAMMPPLRLTHL